MEDNLQDKEEGRRSRDKMGKGKNMVESMDKGLDMSGMLRGRVEGKLEQDITVLVGPRKALSLGIQELDK